MYVYIVQERYCETDYEVSRQRLQQSTMTVAKSFTGPYDLELAQQQMLDHCAFC